MPIFNVRQYIVASLESVINQTYKNLEIILIDDGSTDGSEKICDEYARRDTRIRLVHQRNKGLSYARNVGLDIMKGDAVAFIDADDLFHPDFIRIMRSHMVQNKADLICCDYRVFYTQNQMTNGDIIVEQIIHESYDRIGALNALVNNKIDHHVWNKVYDREVWKDVRFPNGRVYEDRNTIFRVLDECQSICTLSGISLYSYRIRHGSITNTVTIKSVSDWLLAQKAFESFIQSHIPMIFTDEQLRNTRQSRLNEMIGYYIRLSINKKDNNNNRVNEYLRNQIIEIGHQNRKQVLRTRIGVLLIEYCPWLLGALYPWYYPFRRMYKKHIKLK